MSLQHISIRYLFIWLREKECPQEIRWLILDYIKHPISQLFNKHVLKNEHTFMLKRTYSEGVWTWDTAYSEQNYIDYLAQHNWMVRRDLTGSNQIKGISTFWNDIQEAEGIIRRGNNVPLWWIRTPEPFYIIGTTAKYNATNLPYTCGFGTPDIVWGSGIQTDRYIKLTTTILDNSRLNHLMRNAKKESNPIQYIKQELGYEHLYMVGNMNQKNFKKRIQTTINRDIDELSFRKNTCIHTLLGCTCCNILHDHEHLSPSRLKETEQKIENLYLECSNYGERKRKRIK